MNAESAGLFVHRGSRTENLANELARRLEASRPRQPLAAQTVLVAHPGLRSWLLQRLAMRPLPAPGRGIAANYDMILPWQWYERMARQRLGEDALIGGVWRPEVLRWRLFNALDDTAPAALAAFLQGDDAPRRRFQLAEHLAGLYTQYLTYRADWMLAWESSPPRPGEDWQITLWRQLAASQQRPHRARRSQALLRSLADTAHDDRTDDHALHVFGVSHLPPDLLDALHAYAQHHAVHLYFPDPCREHWVYIRRQRVLLEQRTDPTDVYLEIGHPLLATLGRIAQDFCLSLEERDSLDERDPHDEAETVATDAPLLARLQSSIRCLEPDTVGAAFRGAMADADDVCIDATLQGLRDDASLRVHGCHTRLRELEVLKNALLRMLADDATLQHRDIVVMAPDIGAYAPYLAAVFGPVAQYSADRQQIPWHVADVGLGSTHPLLSAFANLLELSESRFEVSTVMDLLDVPTLARRFAIDASAREQIENWLQRTHVAWGLDAAMKADSGAAAIEQNSWQFGLDRLYAGLLTGDSEALLDDILPLEGIGGGQAETLGQLDQLLQELRRWHAASTQPRDLPDWSHWLLERLDASFLADPRDEAEQNALDNLRRQIAALAQQGEDSRLTLPLPWSVVREALHDAMAQVPERQRFLLGGVTFCGLVPQRSIPFKVVCLLGMNEGEFPRQSRDAGLNRLLSQPRRGDRDTRNEDRYLFLEALMSARAALHISYMSESVHDGKPRNPAAPLAELLQFLDTQFGLDNTSRLRPWLLQHPLQPYDRRYYERDAHGRPLHDPRLFSYQPHWLADSRGTLAAEPVAAPSRSSSLDGEPPPTPDLSELKQFWRDPARHQLQRQRGISLDALADTRWPDQEPLLPTLERRARIDQQLWERALLEGALTLPSTPPDWLARSGALASGAIGARAYADTRDSVQPLLEAMRAIIGPAPLKRANILVEPVLTDGSRVSGVVDHVWQADTGARWLLAMSPEKAMDFRQWLPFYLDWAALRLSGSADVQPLLLEQSGHRAPSPPALLDRVLHQNDAQLRAGLTTLTMLYRSSMAAPLLFFPRTAWAWIQSKPEARDKQARLVWLGNDFQHVGERDYLPGYAALLTRDSGLFERGEAHPDFVRTAIAVMRVLDPDFHADVAT